MGKHNNPIMKEIFMCFLKGHIFPKKQVVPAPLKKSSIGSTTFLKTIALGRFQLFERAQMIIKY
jgi:hypothetical protein